jgi:hypothetical protein
MDKNSSRASEGKLALEIPQSEAGVKIVSTCRSCVRNLPRGHACGGLLRLALPGILVVIRELKAVESFCRGSGKHSKGCIVRPRG